MRFYENELPDINDMVIVKVNSIEDMGVYVSLLEYDNIEGMIQMSELSRKRIRSISNIIRVGTIEICVVLRVDKIKIQVDLSKKKVNTEDIEPCQQRYNKSKSVNGIITYISSISKVDLKQLYEDIIWPLNKQYGCAYDAFKSRNPNIFDFIKNEDVKKHLIEQLNHKFKSKPVKLCADFEISCYTSEGIDAIKYALNNIEGDVKIQLISSPKYIITTINENQNEGILLIEKSLEEIKNKIMSRDGMFEITSKPTIITEEINFNKKVESDDDEEEDDVVGMGDILI